MCNVMLDLETLSTAPNSAILTIGAIKFDRNSMLPLLKNMDSFYERIDLKSCQDLGLHVCKETQDWWSKQSKEAREEAFAPEDRIPIKMALIKFAEWFDNTKYLWSHGDDFDCVILESAYRACDLPVPWKFWSTRDTRTLFDLAGVNLRDYTAEVAHHALHDSYRQITAAKEGFQKLHNN